VNPVVSEETVMYGYESYATLTTDRLQYTLQTRLLVREGAPKRRAKQFSGKRKEIEKSGHGPDTKTDRPTDHRSQHQPNSVSETFCLLVFRIQDDRQSPETQQF
jgi:hypothetical protein